MNKFEAGGFLVLSFCFCYNSLIKWIISAPYLTKETFMRNQAHESNRPEKTGKKSYRWTDRRESQGGYGFYWLPTEEKVRVAMDFIDYLKSKEEMEATLEILSSQELMDQIQAAERALKSGAKTEFISWEKVRRDV